MPKSFEAIGLFIKMCTIAIEVSAYMTEMNVSMQNRRIIITELVVMKIIRMNQIDTIVLRFNVAPLLRCNIKAE